MNKILNQPSPSLISSSHAPPSPAPLPRGLFSGGGLGFFEKVAMLG